ncbi:MAG: hypothetical protein OXI80_15770 [Caldilineaceae bacterium]|nr:hypothetical protein [Caldilineaceae bacterium]
MTANDWLTLLFYFVVLPLFAYLVFWLGAHGGDFYTRMKRRRPTCQNCHYLIKESPQLPLTIWNERERHDKFPRINVPPNELEHDEWGRYKGYDLTIGCHKKIWASEHNEMTDVDRPYHLRELAETLTRNRGESCFFVPYHKGMPMETAEQLFSVKSENRRTNKRIIWAQIGSGLALVTSLLSIYLQFI